MSVTSARGPRSLLAPISNAELADLLTPVVPPMARAPNVVTLRWCPTCAGYMLEGSVALGQCVTCGTPRPA